MDAGAFGDLARRCAFEAILGEGSYRGIKEFVLRDNAAILLLAHRPDGPLIGFY